MGGVQCSIKALGPAGQQGAVAVPVLQTGALAQATGVLRRASLLAAVVPRVPEAAGLGGAVVGSADQQPGAVPVLVTVPLSLRTMVKTSLAPDIFQ
jgi:hypothetical protein